MNTNIKKHKIIKISLKEDKSHYKKIDRYYINGSYYGFKFISMYKFETGNDIDCYHRLKLSYENLKTLVKLGISQKKIENIIINCNNTQTDIEENDELKSLYADHDKLEQKFINNFVNPFCLTSELENVNEDGKISFIFRDFDFEYHVIHVKDGWLTYCTNADYECKEEIRLLECDAPARPF